MSCHVVVRQARLASSSFLPRWRRRTKILWFYIPVCRIIDAETFISNTNIVLLPHVPISSQKKSCDIFLPLSSPLLSPSPCSTTLSTPLPFPPPQLRASLGLLASITQPVSTNYDYWMAGRGGHVHIIDSGVNRCHPSFATAEYTGYANCVEEDPTLNAESILQSRVHFPWYVGG